MAQNREMHTKTEWQSDGFMILRYDKHESKDRLFLRAYLQLFYLGEDLRRTKSTCRQLVEGVMRIPKRKTSFNFKQEPAVEGSG
jgi:hypothetical protein